MAAELGICGSSEMPLTQKDSLTAVKLLQEKETVNKLDQLYTQNAKRGSAFLDVAVASQILLIAMLLG